MAKAQNRTSIAGYTLTEAAIVLGIAGIIFSSIWLAASSVNETNTLRAATENIVKITQNIRMLYLERNSFTSSNGTQLTDMLVNAAVFPQETLNSSSKPMTPWDTTMTVFVETPKSFKVVLGGDMPTDVCFKLSAMMIGPGREPALTSIIQDSTTITTLDEVKIKDLNPCKSVSFIFNLN